MGHRDHLVTQNLSQPSSNTAPLASRVASAAGLPKDAPVESVTDFYGRQRQDRERDYASPACSLITLRGSLSSRKPANFAWRKWSEPVHSRNSIRATISGLTQTHFSMSAAVSPSPQRPLCLSGRLTNGHSEISRGLSLTNTWRREAGTKPFRTRAT